MEDSTRDWVVLSLMLTTDWVALQASENLDVLKAQIASEDRRPVTALWRE
jgi:hypothetical protein